MKEVAILTINDYNNYGNRLQNYAAQEVLTSLGVRAETVVNNTKYVNPVKPSKVQVAGTRIKQLINTPISTILTKIEMKLKRSQMEQVINKRRKAFIDFTTANIKETDFSISENNIPLDLANKYDYFVTGSDQVWNPNFRHGSPIDFLTFAPIEKRIAFSPSFGVSEIPQSYVQRYKTWISEMGSISVREKAGAKLIKELTNRDAPVLVDPTLMLGKDKWLAVAKEHSNKPVKKFLLTYFLGTISKERNKMVESIARENDLEIINLGQMKDKETYIAGPSEFIDYIHSASVLCTDSFHGAVFSILLNTPFIVYDRNEGLPSMNSRIDTLLSTFQLEYRNAKNIQKNEQIFNVDYSHIPPILELERNKVYDYLKEALDMN